MLYFKAIMKKGVYNHLTTILSSFFDEKGIYIHIYMKKYSLVHLKNYSGLFWKIEYT